MGRPVKVEDSVLFKKLSDVFREVGYEGASLAILSAATGLKRASLYHRFPGGKEQAAREVLVCAETWLTDHVLLPLASDGPPEVRIRAMVQSLDAFYSGGRQACLLNILSSPGPDRGPFAALIEHAFTAWIAALAAALVDAGIDPERAGLRAERAVALVQGTLVLSRGLGTTRPFETCLASLELELLASEPGEMGKPS